VVKLLHRVQGDALTGSGDVFSPVKSEDFPLLRYKHAASLTTQSTEYNLSYKFDILY